MGSNHSFYDVIDHAGLEVHKLGMNPVRLLSSLSIYPAHPSPRSVLFGQTQTTLIHTGLYKEDVQTVE